MDGIYSGIARKWRRCTKCGKSLSGESETCLHCGHFHSEAELKIADRAARKNERYGLIAGVIFFPSLFYMVIRYFSGN